MVAFAIRLQALKVRPVGKRASPHNGRIYEVVHESLHQHADVVVMVALLRAAAHFVGDRPHGHFSTVNERHRRQACLGCILKSARCPAMLPVCTAVEKQLTRLDVEKLVQIFSKFSSPSRIRLEAASNIAQGSLVNLRPMHPASLMSIALYVAF